MSMGYTRGNVGEREERRANFAGGCEIPLIAVVYRVPALTLTSSRPSCFRPGQ
jgi:hypothetical protein